MSEERFDENMNEEIVIEEDEVLETETVEEPVIEPSEPIVMGVEEIPEKKKSKTGKIAVIVAGAILFGVVSGALFGFTNTVVSKFVSNRFQLQQTKTFLTKSDSDSPVSAVADIVEECMPSIVSISSKSVTEVMTFFGVYQKENMGSGSGIVIGKNDTEVLIVTNYHVVADSTELSAMLSHVELPTDAQ